MKPLAATWWLQGPIRLRRANRLLSEAWIDGVYLTAWPRVAAVSPLAVFLLGLLEGATHWSPLAFAGGRVSSSIHAADFAQMLPLLFVAAICGALSSQLGFLLTLGFVLGDLLMDGSQVGFGHGKPIMWVLFHVYAPKFISYLAFFLLTVTPAVTAKSMAASLPRWLQKMSGVYMVVAGIIACAVQGFSIYGWTLAAPMIVRVHWLWSGGTPPIAVVDYIRVLDPWLPLTAAGAMAARLVLSFAGKGQVNQPAVASARRRMLALDKSRIPSRLMSVLSVAGAAALSTILISGLFDSVARGIFVFCVVVAMFTMRKVILPKLPLWAWWARLANHIPAVVRWTGTIALSYFVARSFLSSGGYRIGPIQVPDLSPAANNAPGAFGAEIICFLLSLIIATLLFPNASPGTPAKLSGSARLSGKVALLLCVFAFATQPVFAQICLDPFCCFGGNSVLAALVIAALVLLALPLIIDTAAMLEAAETVEVLSQEDEAAQIASESWSLGKFKSAQKWENQMSDRGWTPSEITDTIANGDRYPAPNHINPVNPATRYVNPNTGKSVVVDATTHEVLHVGGVGFDY